MQFPYRALRRPLDARARSRVERALLALGAWQLDLKGWPAPARGLPDATPFVSVYAAGRLAGCFGSSEGKAGERLARAFLQAIHDARYGSLADFRDEVRFEVSYPIRPVRVALSRARRLIEPGRHGLAFARPEGFPVLLLPSVARDGGLDANRMLELLAKKLGIAESALGKGTLFVCETDTVVARPFERLRKGREPEPESAAAAWLADRIGADGQVEFGLDPSGSVRHARGLFHHGRAAIVVRALADHGGHAGAVRRARRRLERDIAQALRGRRVEGFPEHPAEVAGTLALASLAGIDVSAALERWARHPELSSIPWHAAQVVHALGPGAPRELFAACARDLDSHPWAPWTVLAARSIGDARGLERAERVLIRSIRRREPYLGGAGVTPIVELALTAVVIEALAESRQASAREARSLAADFLKRWQILRSPVPAAFDASLASGGFPLSPVIQYLRSDVTAHALRALLAQRH